jgi:hypothetical protein
MTGMNREIIYFSVGREGPTLQIWHFTEVDDRDEQGNYIFQCGKRRTSTSNMAFYRGAVLKWHFEVESLLMTRYHT